MNPNYCGTGPFYRDHNNHTEGYGEVTFHRTDNRTVVLDHVRVDSIGTDAGHTPLLVVTGEQEDGTIFHLPFVEYWTIEYRF